MSKNKNIIETLKNQDIKPDLAQIELIKELNQIDFSSRGIFILKNKNKNKNNNKNGLYIWGDVGRGKTLITKTFIDSLSKIDYLSLHYIDFISYINEKLTKITGKKDPLKIISEEIIKKYKLIFIDEFQVEDIADAMIIGDLLVKIINSNVNLILTSNAHIDDLYKDGLQRQKFLKSMKILKEKMNIFNLQGEIDYRLKNIIQLKENSETDYFSDDDIRNFIFENFSQVSENTNKILINDRSFECKFVSSNILWIGFKDFFRNPTGKFDFKYLSKNYDWIFISDFKKCDDDSMDIIRRFISFIDITYVEKVKIKFFFNDTKIHELYSGNKLKILWDRCSSRLVQMQNYKYLENDLIQ